ncbi:MAG: quinolinate synthase NadA [Clostridia bacterium]|nr:quinolinate synthase NadA [Clostridia bacterium]
MLIREMQDKILKLKSEKDFCILAHSYVAREIVEIADIVGDSFALSKQAIDVPQKNLLMCGVRFMAETAKIMSPEKKVWLANSNAGCPMAEQFSKEELQKFKDENPDCAVVAYINTTAELKTLCDVCVTSSSAIKIVKNLENDKILFIPDCNLGSYIANQLPNKDIKLIKGGCPVHAAITEAQAKSVKQSHPKAKLLVHPECVPSVVALADYVGSTSGIMDYAINSSEKEFIIGTETSITEHLQYTCPDKKFYNLSKNLVCDNMKSIILPDVYNCLLGEAGEEIIMSDKLIKDAKKPIDEMIRLG